MEGLLWIYVIVVAVGAATAIVARREGRYAWAVGVGVTSVLAPPIGAVLSFAYWTQIRRRDRRPEG